MEGARRRSPRPTNEVWVLSSSEEGEGRLIDALGFEISLAGTRTFPIFQHENSL